ncbi:hypothetical protein SELMODRAFT_431552 [Selaginella moellendorffii]|uniref:Uncharacterized protein n=1 Tax=Selaginella moellendorffii TaxID=88036 RepID=D8TD13_SELML|nr:hypothetical protein SELMODRAFT_431552 [Selaginella moellendorffii]
MMPLVGSFSSSKAHAPENDNHLTNAEAFFNRRIIQFVKKQVALMEKDDQDITANRSNAPEEVLGTALDNDPKRLKAPAYYNEVVFVSPFAKDRRLPDLCGEQIRQHPPAQVHLADRHALLGNATRIGSERRRGYDGWSYDRDDVSTMRGFTLSSTTRIKVLKAGTTTRIKRYKPCSLYMDSHTGQPYMVLFSL